MLQNLPPKRVCRQILPQLNQKPKSKKNEEKSTDISKVSSAESSSKELVEELAASNSAPIQVTENKKQQKVKNIERVVNETISNGKEAILVDIQKTVKSVKPIRKVNQKIIKDVSEEKNVIQTQKPEINPDDNKKKLRSSPRNQSNLEVVEENISSVVSPVKRRPKKIGDCIARLQEKLGLPFFDAPTVEVQESNNTSNQTTKLIPTVEDNIKPVEIENKVSKNPKRKSFTRKIVKTESMASLTKKADQPMNVTSIKPIQVQAVQPTIQQQAPAQHYTQKPIAHVEAIRPKHFTDTNLPQRRPSILLPTLVPPPPPPPIILPSNVSLLCEQDDSPLDLSRKPVFENGALDLSKPSIAKLNEVKTHSIADILKSKPTTDIQPKRRRNKKEIVSVSPIPKTSQPLPIVNELKNKLPNVSITSKCVLNIPQTQNAFELMVEPTKKPANESTPLVIPNFKGCVDIIKIPAPKPQVIHTEKPSVTIKAIPAPISTKPMVLEKVTEKGFIGAFESFIEKKAADNTAQPPPQPSKESDTQPKAKQKKSQKKSKGNIFSQLIYTFV